MNVSTVTTVGSAIEITSQPYFLGGEHRQVLVNGKVRLSIIPQPAANGIHAGLFEIGKIGYSVEENLEVMGKYCTEEQIAQIIGQMVINGSL
jgi:hypothetical protein